MLVLNKHRNSFDVLFYDSVAARFPSINATLRPRNYFKSDNTSERELQKQVAIFLSSRFINLKE